MEDLVKKESDFNELSSKGIVEINSILLNDELSDSFKLILISHELDEITRGKNKLFFKDIIAF